MTQILVTGATGHLGGQTVDFLLDRVPAANIVALARDPAKLARLANRGVEVRRGDYFDRASLKSAFQGVDKLLFVSTVTFTDGLTQHRNIVEAAKAAAVGHIHYTGVQRPLGSDFAMSQITELERETEAALARSGLAVTLLRNGLYLDALPFMLGDSVLTNGVRAPAGDAPAALVARRDLAEANAIVLASEGHDGKSYTLGGSEHYTMTEVAAILSKISGRSLPYENISTIDFIAARAATGLPEPVAAFLAEWFMAIAAGEFAETTGDLEQLLCRKPVSAEQFLAEAYG